MLRGCRQVVRHELPKLAFAGSSPVTRSIKHQRPPQRRPYIIRKALMANERQHTDQREAAKDAASGYAVIVLAVVCFILLLALITVIVRFLVGAGASA